MACSNVPNPVASHHGDRLGCTCVWCVRCVFVCTLCHLGSSSASVFFIAFFLLLIRELAALLAGLPHVHYRCDSHGDRLGGTRVWCVRACTFTVTGACEGFFSSLSFFQALTIEGACCIQSSQHCSTTTTIHPVFRPIATA